MCIMGRLPLPGGPRRCCCEGMSEAYCRMLSTEINSAPVACLCPTPGRWGARGAVSRASVMSTVGPLLLLAVGPLILLAAAIHSASGRS